MTTRYHRSRLLALAVGVLLAGSAGTAAAAVQDPLPVGPGQTFTGQVNGAAADAAIRTDCLGPIVAGETGHPVSGQYVEAVTAPATAADSGYTGTSAHLLQVTLVTPSSSSVNGSVIGTLNSFFVQLPIPTTLVVPCTGTGEVSFTPAPTSPTARTATVDVQFLSGP